MNAYFLELSKQKRRQPDDLIISRLVDATYEDETGVTHRLTDEDIATFSVLIAAAGSETVTKLVGNGVVAFQHNPEQWELVLADPGVIPGAIEEMLRLNPPSQYQGRFATRDVVLEGSTIPAGSPTLLVTGAASRDPRAYDRPDAFDVKRGGSPPWLSDSAHTAAWAPGWRDWRLVSRSRDTRTGRVSRSTPMVCDG